MLIHRYMADCFLVSTEVQYTLSICLLVDSPLGPGCFCCPTSSHKQTLFCQYSAILCSLATVCLYRVVCKSIGQWQALSLDARVCSTRVTVVC